MQELLPTTQKDAFKLSHASLQISVAGFEQHMQFNTYVGLLTLYSLWDKCFKVF